MTLSLFANTFFDGDSHAVLAIEKEQVKRIEIDGRRYGRLLVAGYAGKQRWNCVCDCGGAKAVLGADLRAGKTRSCGCLLSETSAARRRTHGHSASPLYGIWSSMKRRCASPADPAFGRYGGRGIGHDPAWTDFEGFFRDMAEGWAPGLSLDRIDNDKGYSAENCRWTTRDVQSRNKRNNIWFDTPDEGRICLTDAAEKAGVSRATLKRRAVSNALPPGWSRVQ